MPKRISSLIKNLQNVDEIKPGKNSITIIAAPDDRAIKNVGGRTGAAQGPEAIKTALSKMMTGLSPNLNKTNLYFGPECKLGNSIKDAHRHFADLIKIFSDNEHTTIAIGGGHDFGYPHVLECQKHLKSEVAVINVDAHLDLRSLENPEKITSGCPFYLAIESGILNPKNLVEFGIQPHCNDLKFFEYAKKKQIKVLQLKDIQKTGSAAKLLAREIQRFKKRKLKIIVSFDVDSVSMAWAPGVSAPQIDGFTAAEFLEFAEIAGREKSVISIGFFEFAPNLDSDSKTEKLVSTAIHRFISARATMLNSR